MSTTLTKTVLDNKPYLVRSVDPVTGKRTRRKEVFTSERVQKIADTANKMLEAGLRIYAPYKHDFSVGATPESQVLEDGDSRKNLGYWKNFRVVDGTKLEADIELPLPEDHPDMQRIGTTITEVSPWISASFVDGEGREFQDAIQHIALVNGPIMPGQENFKGSSILMSLDEDEDLDSGDIVMGEEGASGDKQIEAAISVLRQLGLQLPEDTTRKNIIERIVIIGQAVISARGNGMNGAVEVRSPILMSLGLEDTDPIKKQLVVATRKSYKDRIESLVQGGRIPKSYAEKELVPFVSDSFSMSLDDEGQITPHALDAILPALERLPKNSVLDTAKLVRGKAIVDGVVLAHEEPQPDMDPNNIDADAGMDYAAQIRKASGSASIIPIGSKSRVEAAVAAANAAQE